MIYLRLLPGFTWVSLCTLLMPIRVSVQQGKKICACLRSEEKWRNFLIVRCSNYILLGPCEEVFQKSCNQCIFCLFISYMQYTDVVEKRNTPVFFLVLFGPSLPFQEGRRDCWGDQDIFWHSLHSKDTKMFQMLCCREGIAVCMIGRFQLRRVQAGLVWSPNSTAWKSPVWWRDLTQSWDFSFPTLDAMQVWGRQGTRWEGMMVQSCAGGCCQAGILRAWSSSSAVCCGSYYHTGHTATQAHQPMSWSGREATLLCCKWVRHGLTTRERGERQRDESAPKSASRCACQQRTHAQQLKHCGADHRPHPLCNSCTLKLRLGLRKG